MVDDYAIRVSLQLFEKRFKDSLSEFFVLILLYYCTKSCIIKQFFCRNSSILRRYLVGWNGILRSISNIDRKGHFSPFVPSLARAYQKSEMKKNFANSKGRETNH